MSFFESNKSNDLNKVVEGKILTHIIGDGGTPVSVHVKDGKIIRVRPVIFDEKEVKLWSLKIGDRIFKPPYKTLPSPFELGYKKYVYNEKRIKYPMKRTDFNPKDRRHPENRGKSSFERISWDEALDIIADEMKRIKEEYGPAAIFYMFSAHYQKAVLHKLFYPYSDDNFHPRLFSLFGGCTTMVSNPDSWEGWYWGAQNVWGSPSSFWAFGVMEQRDLLEDVLKNSEFLISWSCDSESQLWLDGQDFAIQRIWIKELGKKHVSISPDLNYDAGLHADKWIPIKPGTDAALAEAIAHVWITEGTYDKQYVKSHGYGFEKWKDNILGVEDKNPKTPNRAEKITGVKARIIKALAKEWASKRTTLVIKWGGACRVRYGTEWAKMMVLLQTMQGLGKPGINIWEGCLGEPVDPDVSPPPLIFDAVAEKMPTNPVKQKIYRLYLADALLDPPIKWHSLGAPAGMYFLPPEHMFQEYEYPMHGHSEVRMIYRQGTGQISTWCNTNKWIKAYQSSKIEFIVTQDIWMGGEAPFSDIILPACSPLEREDVCPIGRLGRNYKGGVYAQKCIEPLWDTKSDWEIYTLLAERLGIKEEFTEGKSQEEWLKKLFEQSSLPDYISWEDFKKKGYHIFRFPDNWDRRPGIRWYSEMEEGQGLQTPSGKIEFFSQTLNQRFPEDRERPAVPRYIESEESVTSPMSIKYPLLMITPHPRYRFHTQHAQNPWMNEIPGTKIFQDGYYYESIWINPKDAEKRGINYGDVVRVFNDRGEILCAAHVTERMMEGVVRVAEGSWYDPVTPGEPYSIDKGGAVNLLTSDKPITKDSDGMVPNAFLVQVAKKSGD